MPPRKKKCIHHIENIEPNELIEDTLYFLKLLNDDHNIKYEKIVTDQYLRDDYFFFNLIRLSYDEIAIIKRYDNLNKNSVAYKTILSTYNKIKYEKIVTDKYLRDDYFNLIRLSYDKNAIIKRKDNLNKNSVAYKTIFSTYNKIKYEKIVTDQYLRDDYFFLI